MTYSTPTPTKPSDSRLPARAGTIVWGGILLLAAAIAATASLVDAVIYTPEFVLWTIIGFGGLLVLAGLIGAVARVSTRSHGGGPSSKPKDPDASDDTEPIAGGLFN
jgi:hypothetical protein